MCASSVVTPQAFHTEPAPLAQGLPEFQRQLAKTLPPDAHARLAAAIDGMFATKPGAAALKVGQPAPDFVLPSLDGGTVALANELLAGPVVLTFYRGSWCPYCDLQLRAYAKLVPLLRSASARLLAVSPQAAEAAVPNASDHRGLGFRLLTDAGGNVARRYGLAYVLDDAMRSLLRWSKRGGAIAPVRCRLRCSPHPASASSFPPRYSERRWGCRWLPGCC